MSENTRTPRTLTTRAAKQRVWQPPSTLPEPTPEEGYTFRWVRVATLGKTDAKNISDRFREGFEPVRAEDHPELQAHAITDPKNRYVGGIEHGGLLLCKIPNEFVAQRNAYYNNQTQRELEGADNSLMRENDPRMPLLRPERSTEVSFGSGK